jgi:uncharacterized integral membrane protein
MTAAHNHRDISTSLNGQGEQHPPSQFPAARRSRIGGLWIAAVVFALVLLLLLIFILENGQRADVSFFGTHGHLPMGVALLLAAVFGVLLVALPGTARIVQLRLTTRRSRAALGLVTPPVVVPTDAGDHEQQQST